MNKIIYFGLGVLAIHLTLNELRKRKPTVHYVNRVPFNYNAITIPPVGIFVHNSQRSNADLLNHELIHWSQYQRAGLLPYYLNYSYWMAERGYDNHPMEIEARFNESEYCKKNYTACVRAGSAKTVRNLNFRA